MSVAVDGACRRLPRLRAFTARATACLLACATGGAAGQQLVASASHDYDITGPGVLLVIDDVARAWSAPPIVPNQIAPLAPHRLNPHGFVFLDGDRVAAANAGKPWIDLIDVAEATIEGFFHPDGVSGTAYNGFGTVAVNPARSHLLLAPGSTSNPADRNKLWVVPFPLSPVSTATHVVSLPGEFGTAQTQAIAFDAGSGRAYVGHSQGITAIDPPYTQGAIAFTLALAPVSGASGAIGRALALAPDGSVLVSLAATQGHPLTVVHAPLSAVSATEEIAVPNAVQLIAAAFVPGGNQLLVTDFGTADAPWQGRTQMFALSLPLAAGSTIERLVFADAPESVGYEAITISPDGRYVALGGGAAVHTDAALRIVRAPYTASGFRSRRIDAEPLLPVYPTGGRGTGMVAFRAASGDIAPQLSIDRESLLEGPPGTRQLSLRVRLSHPVAAPVSVDFATLDGGAMAGIDYSAASGTLVFPPGVRERGVTVTVIGNAISQPSRSFRIALSNPLNATVLTRSPRDGEVLILDDDDPAVAVIATEPPLAEAVVGAPFASAPFAALHLVATLPPQPRWYLLPGPMNPPGIDMDINGGFLRGMPERAGEYTILIQVNGDNPQTAQREYRFVVREDRLFDDGFDG